MYKYIYICKNKVLHVLRQCKWYVNSSLVTIAKQRLGPFEAEITSLLGRNTVHEGFCQWF